MRTFALITAAASAALAFVPATAPLRAASRVARHAGMNQEFNNFGRGGGAEDLYRDSRSARSAAAGDRKVILRKPLGAVLEEDSEGNIFVQSVAPGGAAKQSGQVKAGDQVVMCSATFGNQLWSTRNVGLSSIMTAIRVRQGSEVTLVLETPERTSKRAAQAKQSAGERAQEARDRAAEQKRIDNMESYVEQERGDSAWSLFGLFGNKVDDPFKKKK